MDKGSPFVFSGDLPSSTIRNLVARDELTRIATGAYVTSGYDPVQVVLTSFLEVAGRMVPGAVISDRSAPTAAPVDGVLYLVRDGAPRDIGLPGLTIRVRRGSGPLAEDIPLPHGLRLASTARALAENCLASRARKYERRTLSEAELGDWVDRLYRNEGPQRLAEHRRQVEALGPRLGVPESRLARVRDQIGIALGTQIGDTASAQLSSRRRGLPIDQARVARFEMLVDALRRSAPQSRPAPQLPAAAFEPFAEAYFSNFIEGTEFEFDEAARIIFEDEVPANRPQDAHDIIGTYRLLADRAEMSVVPADEDEFLEVLRRRHRRIMAGRPEKRPGMFKTVANRAGGSVFVDPDDVAGTLMAGFRLRQHLDAPWERAVYVAFVVAEVHPFDDGNGRAARAMMAAELDAGAQARIIIPTVFRDDYFDGLRMLTRRDDAGVLIKAMRYAHDFTASIDFTDYATMKGQLEEANAFQDPGSPNRLRLLGRRPPSHPPPWRG